MKLTRKTTESQIVVELSPPPVAGDYRSRIDTGFHMLNHMIEHIVWRSGINICASCTLDRFALSHVVYEDIGVTLGRTIWEYLQTLEAIGYGGQTAIIDEARASCFMSFESRAACHFDSRINIPTLVENEKSEDFVTFLEGIAQGAHMTLHINVERGENAHHIWEAVFRAFGMALRQAFSKGPSATAGVCGNIIFELEQ